MTFGPFEIFLLVVAGLLVLFLLIWGWDSVSRWWSGRHLREPVRRSTNPGFKKRR